MTFFLNAPEETPVIPANNPKVDLPDWSDGYSAAVSKAQLQYNSNFLVQRRRNEVRQDLANKVLDRVGGMGAVWPEAAPGEFQQIPNFEEKTLELARQAAELDPEAWSDVDLSDEWIDERTNETLRTEYQEAQEILGMMSGGAGAAGFLGEMTALVGDVKTLPLFLVGGGGTSFARAVGQEAVIGAGFEVALLPSQFAMADRLEIPDPNVAERIAFGAAAGGIFGGALYGAGRGYQYFKGRQQTQPIGRMDELESEVIVDQAEDILTSNTADPMAQIKTLMDEAGEAVQEPPYRLENPINPERGPLLLSPSQRVTAERPDPITPESQPVSDENLIETAQAGIDRADPAVSSKPIKQPKPEGRRPTTLKDFVRNEGGLWLGDEGISDIRALEYKRPGFTKKSRIEYSEAGDNGGGLTLDEMRSRAVEQGYLPGDATITDLKDALDADIRGTNRVYSQADEMAAREWDAYDGVDRAQRYADDAVDEPRSFDDALADYEAMRPSPTFIDREKMDLSPDPEGDIQVLFNSWAEESGYGAFLTPNEAEEILSTLQERGGDPDLLAELVLARELDYAELPIETGRNAPFDPNDPRAELPEAGGRATGEPRPATGEAGEPRAGSGDGGTPPRASEATAAGDQTLIDGVAPVTQRDRLEAAQNAPMRGGTAAADDGLFDVGQRGQADMFSDPASPEAQKMHEITSNNMREEIASDGDFDVSIEMPDGSTRVMSARETLDYLDEGDAFSARLDLCGMGPN